MTRISIPQHEAKDKELGIKYVFYLFGNRRPTYLLMPIPATWISRTVLGRSNRSIKRDMMSQVLLTC